MSSFYFNAITVYRVSNYLHVRGMFRLSKIVDVITYLFFNCSIPGSCSIGQGTYCSHRGMSVVIHPDSIIGRDCVIGTCVTLGGKGMGEDGAPVLKDSVYVSTGSKLLGGIVVGEGAIVGANSVVLASVDDGAVVVGIPARKIR